MPKPRHHVLICSQVRAAGHPRGCCAEKGAGEIYDKFASIITDKKLFSQIVITRTECFGPCQAGANVLVYPDGTLYVGVSSQDVHEIVEHHLIQGKPVLSKMATSDVW